MYRKWKMVKVSLKWVLYFWMVFVDRKEKKKHPKQKTKLDPFIWWNIYNKKLFIIETQGWLVHFALHPARPSPQHFPEQWSVGDAGVNWKVQCTIRQKHSTSHLVKKAYSAGLGAWCGQFGFPFFSDPQCLQWKYPSSIPLSFSFFPPSRLHASFTLWEKGLSALMWLPKV